MGRLFEHRIKNAQCTETQSRKHNFAPAPGKPRRPSVPQWRKERASGERRPAVSIPVGGKTIRRHHPPVGPGEGVDAGDVFAGQGQVGKTEVLR